MVLYGALLPTLEVTRSTMHCEFDLPTNYHQSSTTSIHEHESCSSGYRLLYGGHWLLAVGAPFRALRGDD